MTVPPGVGGNRVPWGGAGHGGGGVWQMMTFLNPLDALIPKIPFSFFPDFWVWVTSEARGSVSVGFWGSCQLSLFLGGGPAGGLYRPPPPPQKRKPGLPSCIDHWMTDEGACTVVVCNDGQEQSNVAVFIFHCHVCMCMCVCMCVTILGIIFGLYCIGLNLP